MYFLLRFSDRVGAVVESSGCGGVSWSRVVACFSFALSKKPMKSNFAKKKRNVCHGFSGPRFRRRFSLSEREVREHRHRSRGV